VENSLGPSPALEYTREIEKWHAAFTSQGIAVDMVGRGTDLGKYAILAAPLLYLLGPETAPRIVAFVDSGGVFVTGFMSGMADPNDRIFPGGYPGPPRRLLGLWVEEIDALPPERQNRIIMHTALGELDGSYACNLLFSIVRNEAAEVLATYGDDFYAGTPVLTRKPHGSGSAWYLASSAEPAFLKGLVGHLARVAGSPRGEACSSSSITVMGSKKWGLAAPPARICFRGNPCRARFACPRGAS
jgi:beta-galactosidase